MEATVNPSGSLWSRIATKTRTPSDRDTARPEAIERPSKKACTERPASAVHGRARRLHGVRVRLLAEVEVRSHGVLEEVDEEVAGQNEKRPALALATATGSMCTREVASMKPAPRPTK